MRRSLILALCLLVGSLSVHSAIGQMTSGTAVEVKLKISITDIRNEKGQIMIWIWNAPSGFPVKGDEAYRKIVLPASSVVNGAVNTSVTLPTGTYAVSTLHDENHNGQMDKNFMGMPKEGYGSSSKVITHLHPPSFDQAKFTLPSSGAEIAVVMHY
jgi:uncharacterized protein (DUF2141 family)